MEDVRDMAAVALPFAAGVAACAALAGGAASGFRAADAAAVGFAAAAVLTGAVGLMALLFRRRTGPLPYVLLFFFLGCFCFLSRALLPQSAAPGPAGRLAADALAGLRRLMAALPFAHGSTHSLVAALMTGDRSGLTAEQTAAFRDSGASHILALSGLHLGVIYLIVSKLLSVFGNAPTVRRIRSALTLATGAGPSIVRAFLFILIRETCSLLPERRTDPVRILMTALTLQLAFTPEVITSLGFQLSYLAMTGITVLYPLLSSWYPSPDERGSSRTMGLWMRIVDPLMRRIWQGAALAVSCQIFTAPLAWIRFHSFPKYFIITNLLALPLTSALMAAAVAAIALQGLGGCPAFVASTVDFLAQSLLFVLDVISSL
jgi:competence protein ComEC